jgi:hypothetical protein
MKRGRTQTIDEWDGFLTPTIIKLLICQRLFRDGMADLRMMEREVRRTGLESTIFRSMHPRTQTRPFGTAVEYDGRDRYQISRADPADTISSCAEEGRLATLSVSIAEENPFTAGDLHTETIRITNEGHAHGH